MAKALQIPANVLNNLDKVDEKINKIATDSENMAKAFQAAMQRMGDGSGTLLQRLTEIQGVLRALGGSNTSGLNNVASGMGKVATEGEKTASAVAKAAEAMNKWGNSEINRVLSGMIDRLGKVNEDIKTYQAAIGTGKRTYIDFGQQGLAEAEKEANRLMRAIAALDDTQKRFGKSGDLFGDYIDDLNGASLASMRQADEMKKLNAYYSELEKSSARAAAQAEKDAEKRARAEEKAAREAEMASARAAAQAERDFRREEAARARLDSRMRRSNYTDYVTSTEGSLRTAGRATNYNQRAQAIKNLESAMKRLNVADANYQRDLNRLTEAHKKLSEQQKVFMSNLEQIRDRQSNLVNTSQQLARQLALLFSVSQIEGYISKIVQVRGEFELQNTALASILGNKEQADRLFAQITELAVQSPFTIKELTTYTKSLSAYSVEYEKLYDTTKMLADVSSGLGVDMQRLILAFGQVKAANFLRGTETRQFTEAGINMLGELAKYYTELEGRIVSVSEVQDRQFRRMISFQDVEQVFKRLTSAGGMFYNMQERQAETLAGVYSNLQDKIDLMLNDIGKANDGILKGTIKTIGSILENYEAVVAAIQAAGGAFVLYKLNVLETNAALLRYAKAQGIATTMQKQLSLVQLLHVGWNRLVVGIKSATIAMKSFAMSNLWLVGLTALATALYEIVTWNREYNKQIDEINKKHASETASLIKLSEAYDKVAKSAKNANEARNPDSDSYKEMFAQVQKLSEMLEDRGYSLPIKLEFITPDNIDEAFRGGQEILQAASDFNAEFQKALASEMNATQGWGHIFGDNLKTDLNDLSNSYAEVGGAFKANLDILENEVIVASKGLEGAAKEYYDELRTGQKEEETNTEWALRRLTLISNINDLIRIQNSSTQSGIQHEKMLNDLLATRTEIRENEREVEYELGKALDTLIDEYEGLDNLKKQFNENPIIIRTEIDRIFEQMELDAQTKRFAAHFAAHRLQVPIELVQADVTTPTFFNDWRDTVKTLDTEGIFDKQLQSMRSLSDLEDALQKKYKEINDELSTLNRANTERLNLNKQIADAESQLLNPDAQIAENARVTLNNLKAQKAVIENNISERTKELNMSKQLVELIAGSFNLLLTKSSSGSTKDPMLERFKEMVNLIEEAKKRYDELNEEFGSETATQMVRTQFADTPAGDLIATMTFDAQGVVNGLNKAIQSTGKAAQEEYRKVFQDASRPFETKLLLDPQIEKREKLEQQIEDMFSQYDLSIQLSASGVPTNVIEELFGTKIVNLETLKSELEKIRPILEKEGYNWNEILTKTEKEYWDRQKKEVEDAVRTYAEQMKKSISERALLEIEAQKKIAAIRNSDKLSPETKNAITGNIRQQTDIEIGKLDWENFQNSDIYQRLFQNLEYMSTESIERIRRKLDELRNDMGNLSPENLKTINEYYQKLEDVTAERNPFAAMRDSLKEINELRSQGRTEDFLNNELMRLDEERATYEQQIIDLETIIGMKEQQLSVDSLSNDMLARNKDLLDENTETLRAQLSISKSNLNRTTNQIGITQKDLDSYVKARNNASKLSSEIQSIQTLGRSAFGSISEIMDSMGAGMDENEKIMADMAGGLLDLVAQAVLFGIQLQVNTALAEIMGTTINAALGPIGWAVMALQALTMIFSAFSKIHDNKLQEQIDAEQDKIDRLNKTYEKLEETIENGLSIFQYSKSGEQIDLLLEQIKSYERMIDLERDKKKTDEDQIKDWQDEIESIYSQIDDIYKDIREDLVGSFKDAASQLADALQDAFENGEDAAESWGETVNSIIADIIKNAIATRLIEPLLQPLLDEFFAQAMPKTEAASDFKEEYTKALDELAKVEQELEQTPQTSRRWKELRSKRDELQEYIDSMFEQYKSLNEAAIGEIPTITEDMVDDLHGGISGILDLIKDNGLVSMLDDLVSGTNEMEADTMSGLQRGIQGVTEQTAQALEALLESIRYFVSDENAVIHNIYNWLTTMPAETPLMQELRLQTQHLASMDSLLTSVIKSSSGKGKVMRVEIV